MIRLEKTLFKKIENGELKKKKKNEREKEREKEKEREREREGEMLLQRII